jgi:hypothetical protein
MVDRRPHALRAGRRRVEMPAVAQGRACSGAPRGRPTPGAGRREHRSRQGEVNMTARTRLLPPPNRRGEEGTLEHLFPRRRPPVPGRSRKYVAAGQSGCESSTDWPGRPRAEANGGHGGGRRPAGPGRSGPRVLTAASWTPLMGPVRGLPIAGFLFVLVGRAASRAVRAAGPGGRDRSGNPPSP